MLQYLARYVSMSLFRSQLLVIGGLAQRKLVRQVHYLEVENEFLRSKLPARIGEAFEATMRKLESRQSERKPVRSPATRHGCSVHCGRLLGASR